ncbi:MAG TPA: HAD-IC family P-type ATPase [Dongiaceae bacterium]|jgi:H+-transporting ATPase
MDMVGAAAVELEKPSAATPAVPAGLTRAEARRRLAEYGPNTVQDGAPSSSRRFLGKLWGPIPWMLEAAIVLQLVLGAYVEAAVIGALLLFNAVLGFVQEGRAGAALAALKKRLAPTALVRRDGEWVRLPAAEVVPGDAVRLPLGALVPADATILSGGVLVDQSMLTGESVPVDVGPAGQVYAGSLVRRGQAVAEVTATGSKTYFGRAAEFVRLAHAASTEQAAIFSATRNLAVVNGIIAVLIVAYAYLIALPTADLFRLGLTALLATIPVVLPATFTLSAALAAQVLARRGVLLTRLSAAHEAAAMDVLCADKTGTLTRNALGVADVVPMPGFDRDRVLALAAMASSEADQDPIDAAIRAAGGASTGVPAWRLVRFVPFDPASRTSEAFAIDGDGRRFASSGRLRGDRRAGGVPRGCATPGRGSCRTGAPGHRGRDGTGEGLAASRVDRSERSAARGFSWAHCRPRRHARAHGHGDGRLTGHGSCHRRLRPHSGGASGEP